MNRGFTGKKTGRFSLVQTGDVYSSKVSSTKMVDRALWIAQCIFVVYVVISIAEHRLTTPCSDVELGLVVFEEGLHLNHEKPVFVLTLPFLLSRGRTAA